MVASSSSCDDLSLVKHDAQVDLNRSSTRICYTKELVHVSDSPLPSPPPCIVPGQQVGVGHDKVLIPNPKYKGKGHTESASANPTLRVQRRRPPPKICALPGMMEFSDDDMEEEEEEQEELSNETLASLKQKITTLEEQITELHLAVYNHHDDFSVLRKANTSKLKHYAKALSDPSLYNAPSP
jgi:DNA-binding transcriptional MerR regulator